MSFLLDLLISTLICVFDLHLEIGQYPEEHPPAHHHDGERVSPFLDRRRHRDVLHQHVQIVLFDGYRCRGLVAPRDNIARGGDERDDARRHQDEQIPFRVNDLQVSSDIHFLGLILHGPSS
jgi:hypothetical protein